MTTPAPSLNLHVPSLHDSLPLSTRLHLPGEFHGLHPFPGAAKPWTRKAAVVAHPYAPLGGSFDDYVVGRLVRVLLDGGFVVATFNFRGAHGSKGATSWSGKAEVGDYTAIAGWLLAYIKALPCPPGHVDAGNEVVLVLAGYSYGSLITSLLPPTSTILQYLIEDSGPGKAYLSSLDSAQASARRYWDSHSPRRTSYSSRRGRSSEIPREEAVRLEEEDARDAQEWTIRTGYVLVSPLLPPVSNFLTGFGGASGIINSLGLAGIFRKSEDGNQRSALENSLMDPEHRRRELMLVVYGTQDNFTAVKKYRRWREKVPPEVEAVEVEGAAHFWREEGAMEALEREVGRWVGGFVAGLSQG
ncbi:Lipase 5 [Rhizina undulata]